MSRDEEDELDSLTLEEVDAALDDMWDQVVERVESWQDEGQEVDPADAAMAELDLEYDEDGMPRLSLDGEEIPMNRLEHLALTLQYVEHCCNECWHEPEHAHYYNGLHYQIGVA